MDQNPDQANGLSLYNGPNQKHRGFEKQIVFYILSRSHHTPLEGMELDVWNHLWLIVFSLFPA